ncbi:HEPN domain-containing protein [uncultured Corynebacterium sp.]|uniref:HEPN domain-containing protein n=1 Tax=uncultured Corynebacterium sp. TaxID=159447 RepID=UPI0025D1756D|nr:HEPN domain-containing protein [uncultured Corynebacterium sp.]
MTIESKILVIGIALEAAGFWLLHEKDGLSPGTADHMALKDKIARVLKEVDEIFTDQSNELFGTWAHDTAECYNHLKHPKNPIPDSVRIGNCIYLAILVLRVLIAKELGADSQKLTERASRDRCHPNNFQMVRVPDPGELGLSPNPVNEA